MSTTPGEEARRDAGLDPVDGQDEIVHVTQRVDPDADALDEGEYSPGVPLPDADREADEADVVEQADEVVLGDDRDAY